MPKTVIVPIKSSIVFTILLIGMGIMQTELKENPQKIMIGFATFVLLLKIFKVENLATIFFYILLTVLFYNTLFMIIGYIVHQLNPNAGWVNIDGERQRVMNWNWIWGVLGGLIFSPILVYKYHKSIKRNKILEMIFVGIFIIVSILIYLIFEMDLKIL